MVKRDAQTIFNGLEKHRDFPEDSYLREDITGFLIGREFCYVNHWLGWRIDDQGRAISILAKMPRIPQFD